jgi:hypothetical protein
MIDGRYSKFLCRSFLFILASFAIIEAGAGLLCFMASAYPKASRFLWSPDLDLARKNWVENASDLDREIGGSKAPAPDNNFQSPPCGSAYGDSYISGYESENGMGWVERLSNLLGCRIANYSAGGYGIDQNFLRFQKTFDNSPFVLLGIDAHSILNVVSQYDAFLGSEALPTAVKGRFAIDQAGHLVWLATPSLDENRFVTLNRNPAEVIPHDYFLPDTPEGPVTSRFPFSLTLARIARMPAVREILLHHAVWRNLYQTDDASGAMQIMIAISRAFAELASARGKRVLIVILPVAGSFRERGNYGKFEYTPFVDALRASNIPVFDSGPGIIANLDGHPICDLFTHRHVGLPWAWLASPAPCGGHYSSLAHAILAQLAYTELGRQHLKP